MYIQASMIIGGELISKASGGTRPIINPANENSLGDLPLAGPAELALAIEAATAAFGPWSKTPALERSDILRRAAGLVRSRAEAIAASLSMENGKTLAEARGEILATAEIFEWFAEEARRIYGRTIPSRSESLSFTVAKEPVGVVAAFSPWNFPAVISGKKIASALAAGCTVVMKPAEETPSAPFALVQCLLEAGLPAGCVNLVFGDPAEVSRTVIGSPLVSKVTFTGSTAVGRVLAELAAKGPKRLTMELGGHAPVIVMDDVDVAAVARMSAVAKFRNAGQICSSPTRFLIHERVYDAFAAEFTAAARGIKVGEGIDPASQMGPVSNARRLAAMQRLTEDAVSRGAKLLTGGRRIGNNGYFFQPTVLGDVPLDSQVMNEEPFGPIVPLHRISSAQQAIEIANSSAYGLAGYVFAKNRTVQKTIAAALQTGLVGINNFVISLPETPFGGVKDSGYGSEGGSEGIEAYLVTKLISEA